MKLVIAEKPSVGAADCRRFMARISIRADALSSSGDRRGVRRGGEGAAHRAGGGFERVPILGTRGAGGAAFGQSAHVFLCAPEPHDGRGRADGRGIPLPQLQSGASAGAAGHGAGKPRNSHGERLAGRDASEGGRDSSDGARRGEAPGGQASRRRGRFSSA